MKKYDIVIIGSGMGGLVCADILGREGYSVCIIEKNKQIGGCLQTYVRDRVIFDSGVHYLGGLDKGQNLYQIFKYLGILDKLKLKKLDVNCFDKIIIDNDDKEYIFAQGYDNFIAHLLKDFPNEEKALVTYCDRIKEVCDTFPLYNLRTGVAYNDDPAILEVDTKAYLESITTDKKLQAVLAGNNALYAGQADKTPFYVHALILNSYIESSWKCVDGGSQIGKYIVQNIRQQGGEILRNKEVTKIVEQEGVVTHVEMQDGSIIEGDIFISNMHPVKTLEITFSNKIKQAYKSRLNSLENSISSFTINIVFKPNSFKYFNNNYYAFNDGHVWSVADYTEENWPLGYAIFLSASTKMEGSDYAESMTLLTYMKLSDLEPWFDTYNTVSTDTNRGETYEAFKTRKAEKLIDAAEKKFPGLRASIQAYYTATPLSFRDYIGNGDGSLYGIVKDYKSPLKTFISPKTKIDNLYFTGQNLNLHGILGSAMSGIVTCKTIMGNESVVDKIRNA